MRRPRLRKLAPLLFVPLTSATSTTITTTPTNSITPSTPFHHPTCPPIWRTPPLEADIPLLYRLTSTSSSLLLIGNDNSPSPTGIRVWNASTATAPHLPLLSSLTTGRTKLLALMRTVARGDYVLTISMSEAVLRMVRVDGAGGEGVVKVVKVVGLGRYWSAICVGRGKGSGGMVEREREVWYVYLFGKLRGGVFLLREKGAGGGGGSGEGDEDGGEQWEWEWVEVGTFPIPSVDPKTCFISEGEAARVYFSGGKPNQEAIYSVNTAEAGWGEGKGMEIRVEDEGVGKGKVLGMGVGRFGGGGEVGFVGRSGDGGVELVTLDGDGGWTEAGRKIDLPEGTSLAGGFSILWEGEGKAYIVYALSDGNGDPEDGYGDEFFAMREFDPAILSLPRDNHPPKPPMSGINQSSPSPPYHPFNCPHFSNCSNSGFCPPTHRPNLTTCHCFSQHTTPTCSVPICPCASPTHGFCPSTTPTTCHCTPPFTGPRCTTILLTGADYSTSHSASSLRPGYDGDDPAIWIHPSPGRRAEGSRIITTVKSEKGKGFVVHTLKGVEVQYLEAEKPNNVDVLYGVWGDGSGEESEEREGARRRGDVIVAGCRGDNTVCIYAIDSTTTLLDPIPLLQHPLPKGYKPYGSCVHQSHGGHLGPSSPLSTSSSPPQPPASSIFITSKTGELLHYVLSTSTTTNPNSPSIQQPQLTLTLLSRLTVGNGTQLEGCVASRDTLFVGEEVVGVWAYPLVLSRSSSPASPPPSLGPPHLIDGLTQDDPTRHHLDPDIEGIGLITPEDGRGGGGWLVVSNQGTSTFTLHEAEMPWGFVAKVKIVDGEGREAGWVDGVTNTDGVTATGWDLSAGGREGEFACEGLLVVHDDVNEGSWSGRSGDEDGGEQARPQGDVSFKIVDVARLRRVVEGALGRGG